MAMEYTLVLTGGRTGQTCVLGGYQFVNGETIVRGDPKAVDGVLRYLGLSYKAYLKGSQALTRQQEIDCGKRPYVSSAKQGGSAQVQGDLPAGQSALATLPPDNGGGADDSSAGGTGGVPGGDGHSNTGNDRQTTDQDRVLTAIESLDSANDEHWTQDGQPRMDAVEQASGVVNVTRADVEHAKPGYKRGS